MDGEIKKAYLNWAEKGSCRISTLNVFPTFFKADQALLECEHQLNKVGLGIGYTSQIAKLDKLVADRTVLYEYIWSLLYYVEDKIDKPLCEDFRLNATERISRIRFEDIEVDNTLGLTETIYPVGSSYPKTKEKKKLTFNDFVGISDGQLEGNGLAFSVTNGCVEEFSEIFVNQYEAMREAGYLAEGITWQEYWEQFLEQGTFYHDGSTPFENFVSSVLDITIIKPIIEACTGIEWITGEDLSEMERGMKVVFATIDLLTLGQAVAATELAEVGIKDGLKLLGKTVTIEFTSSAAACGVGTLGEALGWPAPVTLLLSFATGVTVNVNTSEILFRGIDGSTIAKMDISEVVIDGKALTYTDVADRLKMQGIDVEVDVTDVKLKGEIGKTPNAFGEVSEDVIEGGTSTQGYSNFADGMSPEDATRYILNNEKAFFNEFSERASAAGLSDTQIAEAFESMRNGDYAKMATYFDTSSPVDGAVFWSGNKEGAAAYANSIGGTIMEQTPGGQVFDNWRGLGGMYPEWDTPTNLAQKPIWDALSSQYANGAEGIATYAHPGGYVGKVWSNIEKPILEENDIIIQEVIIDAK